MRVFEFTDYREFIRNRVREAPQRGHGQYRRMADHLGIPNSLMSQIMTEKREMSTESASLLCDFFSLTELEAEYFMTLVEWARAGNPSLRARKLKALESLKKRGSDLNERISHERSLSEEEKSVFYSKWQYSAVRLVSSIEGRNSIDTIAEALRLPRRSVVDVVQFLLSTGLCMEDGGKIRLGPKSTHVGNESPMALRHHINWRLKSMSNMQSPKDHELMFTGPAVVSQKACEEIKRLLLGLIDEWGRVVDGAREEKLVCLNLDWFDVT